MTIAELKGKLAEGEFSEDLLTSDVFGTFSYLEPRLGLVPFLREAVNLEGKKADFLEDVVEAELIFWPKSTQHRREPDLLVLMRTSSGEEIAWNVECKFLSGKSNRVTAEDDDSSGDQLAEQFEELWKNRLALPQEALNRVKAAGERKYLVYVTAHYEMPVPSMEESVEAFHELRERIYWLSWRQLADVLEQVMRTESLDVYKRRMIQDLRALMLRKKLVPYRGFGALDVQDVPVREGYFWRQEQPFFQASLDDVKIEQKYFWKG